MPARAALRLALAALLPAAAAPAGTPTGFLDRAISVGGEPRRYQAYVPRRHAAR